MPTKSLGRSDNSRRRQSEWELKDLRTLRLAVGTTVAVGIAYGVGWPLYYLTPMLVWNFLRAPSGGLTMAAGLDVIFSLVTGCLFGTIFSLALLRFPVIFILAMWLFLFLLFYANTGGMSPNRFLWMMMGILVVPLLGMQSLELSLAAVGYLIASGVVAVLLTWLFQGLLPDGVAPGRHPDPVPPSSVKRPDMNSSMRLRSAGLSMLAVAPLATIVYVFNLTDELLLMIFAAQIAPAASSAAGAKMSKTMLLGNVLGGAAAIVFYYMILIAPTYAFLIALTGLGSLIFARANFSSDKMAPFYGMAFSNLLLLIGQTTAPGSETVGLKFLIRVGQVTLAGVYLILAFNLFERFQKITVHRKKRSIFLTLRQHTNFVKKVK